MVVAHEMQFGQRPRTEQVAAHLVEHRAGRRRRVLRVQRQHADALDAAALAVRDRLRDRRPLVGHREPHPRRGVAVRRAQVLLQELLLALRNGAQRRIPAPDRGVGVRDAPGAQRDHDAAQDRLPQQRRQLDDAAVGEELGEEVGHRARCRGARRAEIDQDDGAGGIPVRRAAPGAAAGRLTRKPCGRGAIRRAPPARARGSPRPDPHPGCGGSACRSPARRW